MYFSNDDDGDVLNVLLCIGVIIGTGTSAEIGLHLPDWAARVGGVETHLELYPDIYREIYLETHLETRLEIRLESHAAIHLEIYLETHLEIHPYIHPKNQEHVLKLASI